MRLILTVPCAASLCVGAEPLLLQKPTLNKTHIVFVYAGDLWSVPRDGGDAVRITGGAGNETDPASPDGALIAFTGQYDGNVDVFVVPASGGVPKRLTGTRRRIVCSDGRRMARTSFSPPRGRPIRATARCLPYRLAEAWNRSFPAYGIRGVDVG